MHFPPILARTAQQYEYITNGLKKTKALLRQIFLNLGFRGNPPKTPRRFGGGLDFFQTQLKLIKLNFCFASEVSLSCL